MYAMQLAASGRSYFGFGRSVPALAYLRVRTMSGLLADSAHCCLRCLRASASTKVGTSAMRAVTTTSGRSSSPLSRRQKSTKASQKLSRSVSSTRKLHEPLAGRRNLASSSRKRDSATTSATGATADSPVDVPQRKQASVAEAADTSEALRRQLEDLRALLLRVTGNDEARSTRLVAFASHAGGSTEEQAWVERLDRSIARMDTRGERRTRVAGEAFP